MIIADFIAVETVEEIVEEKAETYIDAEPDPDPIEDDEEFDAPELEGSGFTPLPKKRPPGVAPWSNVRAQDRAVPVRRIEPAVQHSQWSSVSEQEPVELAEEPDEPVQQAAPPAAETPSPEPGIPKLKLGIKPGTPQSELSLDSAPRGRFEGETPNVFEGEDLDLPPFLRKKN